MAELSAEAPLARFESDDFNDFQTAENGNLLPPTSRISLDNVQQQHQQQQPQQQQRLADDNFVETFSGSLEDLVNTFDEKITKCFKDLDQNIENLAPVQIRNQDDVLNDCQMWWTLTGNYGNILPIDWSQSTARRLHLPTLQLRERPTRTADDIVSLSDEDEAVASDLDLHALIVAQTHQDFELEPVQTAEEVIKEIDDLLQDPPEAAVEEMHQSPDTPENAEQLKMRETFTREKLNSWSLNHLNELVAEFEWSVQHNSETLISQLALRDELEFEKELKNTFISLLLSVQNKRRQVNTDKKKVAEKTNKNGNKNGTVTSPDAKYITTVIPYHQGNGPPSNQTLQVLIKILKAILEDSPTVPTLLTDYILKVLCPT